VRYRLNEVTEVLSLKTSKNYHTHKYIYWFILIQLYSYVFRSDIWSSSGRYTTEKIKKILCDILAWRWPKFWSKHVAMNLELIETKKIVIFVVIIYSFVVSQTQHVRRKNMKHFLCKLPILRVERKSALFQSWPCVNILIAKYKMSVL